MGSSIFIPGKYHLNRPFYMGCNPAVESRCLRLQNSAKKIVDGLVSLNHQRHLDSGTMYAFDQDAFDIGGF
jgi:hypothetical protein